MLSILLPGLHLVLDNTLAVFVDTDSSGVLSLIYHNVSYRNIPSPTYFLESIIFILFLDVTTCLTNTSMLRTNPSLI